eukprot:scaffold145002_cov115-Phaeocystis_antarctica.AAC.1
MAEPPATTQMGWLPVVIASCTVSDIPPRNGPQTCKGIGLSAACMRCGKGALRVVDSHDCHRVPVGIGRYVVVECLGGNVQVILEAVGELEEEFWADGCQHAALLPYEEHVVGRETDTVHLGRSTTPIGGDEAAINEPPDEKRRVEDPVVRMGVAADDVHE